MIQKESYSDVITKIFRIFCFLFPQFSLLNSLGGNFVITNKVYDESVCYYYCFMEQRSKGDVFNCNRSSELLDVNFPAFLSSTAFYCCILLDFC
jgi:hypothetical protein